MVCPADSSLDLRPNQHVLPNAQTAFTRQIGAYVDDRAGTNLDTERQATSPSTRRTYP